MKPPKFLKVLIAFLICLALIRAVNSAGHISINEFLTDIQTFQFDFSHVERLVANFREGAFTDGFIPWNNTLKGLDGFFTNLRNVLTSFFSTIGSVIKGVVLALWNVLVESARTLGLVVKIAGKVTGFVKS